MYTRENEWRTPVPIHGLAKQLTHAQSHIIHVLAVLVYTAVFSLLGRIWTRKSGVSAHHCRPREIQSRVSRDL